MNRVSLSIVLSIISLTPFLSFPATAQTQPEKWEYIAVSGCGTLESAGVNKLGEEGWELVSVTVIASNCPSYYFKRPKKEIFTPTQPAAAGPTKCNLTPAQAPVFRGIRLGMSTDELLALFPRSKEQSNTIQALGYAEINYGEVRLGFDTRTYPENKEMFSNNIYSYNIMLFDSRVARFDVYYQFPNQNNRSPNWTYMTWIPKLSETYKLPKPEDWVSTSVNYANIACQGFRINVEAHFNQASISIIGPPYEDQIKQRREAASEQLRRDFRP
jgi:hypothetical protein